MFAIVVPYRDREFFLGILLKKIKEYIKSDDYIIVVSEQKDNFNFSNSLSKNIGAFWAIQNIKNITHIIFNEVDTVPIKDIDYITPENVIHFMNFGSSKIKTEDFKKINGYNPLYNGWGQEDNDFLERCAAFDLELKFNFYWRDNGVGVNYDNLEHIYWGSVDRKDKWEIQKLINRNTNMFDFFTQLDKPLKKYWCSIHGINLINLEKIKLEKNIDNKIYYISYNSADYT